MNGMNCGSIDVLHAHAVHDESDQERVLDHHFVGEPTKTSFPSMGGVGR
jgi:hypothetical protein